MDLAWTGRVLTYRGSFGPAADEFYNPWSVFITRAGNIWIGATYNDPSRPTVTLRRRPRNPRGAG